MPSRDDVARLAGVSGATVSYVLNGKPGESISQRTRERVLRAAAKLKYQPSQAARAMVRGRYDQIGILLPETDLAGHWYHLGILHGAWNEVTRHGIRLVMDAVVPGRGLSFVEERFVDGLIAPGTSPETLNDSIRVRLAALRIPVVVIGSGSWSRDFYTVDIDNVLAGRTATQLLLDHGHRRILYFGGIPSSTSVARRRDGFVQAMTEAGLPVGDDVVIDAPYDAEPAVEVAGQVLARHPDVTAFVCYNDATAKAVWHAAREAGRCVPRDLSVIGVDGNPDDRLGNAALATIRQPLRAMGARAVELVREPPDEPSHEFFPFELVPGDTVQAPASAGPMDSSR